MALACACIVAIPGINRATGVTPSSSDFEEAGESARWADSVMASMSLRDRVAQLMVPRFDIAYNAAGQSQLRNVVAQQKVGGILLGKGKASDYAGLIDFAGSVAAVPLMVTLDGEWGPAMRVTDAPRFPYNICLGAIADDNLLYDYGREVARQCRELGIGVDFAPVLDVNSNPRNPVIGYRSFGEDPERVSRLVDWPMAASCLSANIFPDTATRIPTRTMRFRCSTARHSSSNRPNSCRFATISLPVCRAS